MIEDNNYYPVQNSDDEDDDEKKILRARVIWSGRGRRSIGGVGMDLVDYSQRFGCHGCSGCTLRQT